MWPDREQEVRGDSSQPVAGHVTVPINTGHAVAQAQPHSRKLGGSSLNSRFQSGPVQGLLLFRREEMQRHSLVDDDSKREKKKKRDALVDSSHQCGRDTNLVSICTTASSM